MKFQIEWQEWVYDAFDELENIGDRPSFGIQADSLEKAKEIAVQETSHWIDEHRPEGYKQHGMFIPRIIALIDEQGVHRQISEKEDSR